MANVFLGTSLRSLRDVFSVGETLENTVKSQNLVKIYIKDYDCNCFRGFESVSETRVGDEYVQSSTSPVLCCLVTQGVFFDNLYTIRVDKCF